MKTLTDNINRWQAFFLAFIFALAVPGVARAEDKPQTPKEKAYSDLLIRAKQAIDNDKTAEAISIWMEAWNLEPHWHLPCNIGMGYFLLQQADKAAMFLSRCAKLAPFPTTEKGMKHRRRERETLEIALNNVASVVITAPQGARVSVDGEEKGTAPLSDEVFLLPGEHRFIAELNGRTASRTLATKRRETHTIDLAFPQDKAEPAQPKPLEIKPIQTKPIETKPVEMARSVPMALNSAPSSWAVRWVPSVALLGSSAVLAGFGVWMRIEANAYVLTARELAAAQSRLPDSATNGECSALTAQFVEARTEQRRFNNASLISLGGAAALGISGLVYPWLPFHHGKSTSIALSPSSIQVRGSF